MYVGEYNTSPVGFELTHLDENGTNPQLVADLWPGKDSSVPRGLVRLGDRVVFVADTPAFGARWFSADVNGGDITPLPGLPATSLYPDFWQVGDLLFTYRWEVEDDELTGISLYRTDGTPGGSVPLRYFPLDDNSQLPTDFTEFAGVTWFTAYDPEHGRELWRSDGTPEGTKLAADILPGEQSSDPMDLVAADDFLFFTAFDLEHGAEPWRIWSPRPPAPPSPDPEQHEEVRIEPLPLPQVPSAPRETLPVKKLQAIVSVKVKRLRTVGGRTRWKISGRVDGSGCSGRVRIDVNRGQRRLKSITTSLKRCRYEAVVSTTTHGAGRSISVRTLATKSLVAGRSRTVRVR
jgi:ELWxxDGT repeat protein